MFPYSYSLIQTNRFTLITLLTISNNAQLILGKRPSQGLLYFALIELSSDHLVQTPTKQLTGSSVSTLRTRKTISTYIFGGCNRVTDICCFA
jgi:hypothetical protein